MDVCRRMVLISIYVLRFSFRVYASLDVMVMLRIIDRMTMMRMLRRRTMMRKRMRRMAARKKRKLRRNGRGGQ